MESDYANMPINKQDAVAEMVRRHGVRGVMNALAQIVENHLNEGTSVPLGRYHGKKAMNYVCGGDIDVLFGNLTDDLF